MHKYIKIYELKCICKQQAQAIKDYNIEYKKLKKDQVLWNDTKWSELAKKYPIRGWGASRQYRRYHIAHCLLRGKTYEQIENKVREENKLKQNDWDEIEKIRKQYYEVPVEISTVEAI